MVMPTSCLPSRKAQPPHRTVNVERASSAPVRCQGPHTVARSDWYSSIACIGIAGAPDAISMSFAPEQCPATRICPGHRYMEIAE